MNSLLIMTAVISGFLSSSAWAHGEDRPGPHGGTIRMPGAFHTELVLLAKGEFKIYLLDINFKNPSTKKSELQVNYFGEASTKADCQAQRDHYYLCKLPQTVDFTKKGELKVVATRDGQPGAEVTYPLPLPSANASPSKEQTHHHH
ncbi:MAG: hypothetical protein IT288_09495 [Bdellovibrionales bacterium]|nr:hypothetical protein [Bdellovibrionales bacterium]